ncbi:MULTISPECIES: peptidoglycan D,D-transpeptidase FtsI family protein [unclassified Aureimonas]|uniref:peptidoglycan D,D-transpeptidase FtsI family protein n=1 Tax=unclassified Aureimonas TaxID=2615206 RepID=UPI0006F93C18|nr:MULTISPECIES: penicillin-binding protein 2 [unclassified Aureimonas]KQT69947.1 cell division protein [Aureimonas sp. Leaf427]KQT75897.1 cell division protein [Aureimonas sp. Leaf460]
MLNLKSLPIRLPKRLGRAKAAPEAAIAPAGFLPRKRGQKSRFLLATGLFCTIYAVIGGRLLFFGATETSSSGMLASIAGPVTRPDIVDRHGKVLAIDIKTASLFAEPKRIVDVDEATELLRTVLPNLDPETLYRKLSNSKQGFAWLERKLTPRQQQQILSLGLPGIGFRTEKRRFYPGGSTAAHILGLTNIDNAGIAGMEKYIDDSGFSDLQANGLAGGDRLEPVKLAMDLSVQHILNDEIVGAMKRYRAVAAGAVVLDVETGEIIAMASAPTFDPNEPGDALKKENLNRISAGTFEMGSTFKIFTTGMALDSGKVNMNSRIDTTPFRVSGHTIKEFHNKGSSLTVPEIFKYSSNVGSAREADMVGVEGHKEFLTRLGLLSRIKTELPETAMPTQPKTWKKINSMTISFGHGVSTTPLNTAVAAAALINGGWYIPPTFLPRTKAEADAVKTRVVSEKTSADMREIFRINGIEGSGRQANVPGFHVGGKTGTAEKVENGRYNHSKRFNAFVGAFPIEKPRYVVLTIVDEPQVEPGKPNAQAGWNAAPMVGNIVRRSAALLGVNPDFGPVGKALMVKF